MKNKERIGAETNHLLVKKKLQQLINTNERMKRFEPEKSKLLNDQMRYNARFKKLASTDTERKQLIKSQKAKIMALTLNDSIKFSGAQDNKLETLGLKSGDGLKLS